MRLTGKYIIPALLILFMFSGTALAQRGVPIHEKPRPDYDPLGIRAGAFTIKPALTLGLEYSDNIYATKRDKESDMITTVAPEIDISSNWIRHFLGLDAGLESGFYASESDENYLDGHIFLRGRMDILRESFLLARAGFQQLHEQRGVGEFSYQWDEPSVYQQTTGDLSYYQGMGRLSFSTGGKFTRRDFKRVDLRSGDSLNQDFRDYNTYQLQARLAYELNPDVQPFISARYEWRRYDKSWVKRDSDGYRIDIGTGFDLGGVTSGEVFVGYMKQYYDHRPDISGFWYGLSMLWQPTRLTSVEAEVMRSIKETTFPDSSGTRSVDAEVRLDHELLRNLLVGAFFDYTRDSYQGVNVKDNYYTLGPRVTYLWNRNLRAEAKYAYRTKDSNRSHREFTENKFLVSITGAF
ncbi:outer membrane beta-barrel protein [Desulfonatronospira sp.]|uniref:outer membrane beta-barrel protein n=1 Tax=Desulfonatronospira sp. TaxID=1962951 RepID=UPI0025B9539C|nr:outer membrane beta-barrel protein [Desulfonatronospira sp.]